jgi:hypothetical protein
LPVHLTRPDNTSARGNQIGMGRVDRSNDIQQILGGFNLLSVNGRISLIDHIVQQEVQGLTRGRVARMVGEVAQKIHQLLLLLFVGQT